MKSTREQFEEIWPVPDCIEWIDKSGEYVPNNYDYDIGWRFAYEWTGRLDTFIRCQESMFSKEEMNLFRQWFNAVEDLNPTYLEKSDCDLYRKIMERLK